MSNNKINKCALAVKLGLMVGAFGLTMPVMANDAAADDVEVIEVRGIRASQEANLNAKRFSDATVDVVTAENIGKFPDSDVGETLGRISGVAVSRQFGQGQQVSIRGASSQLTSTLLNGHAIASTGWYDQQSIDRSFNYSLLPPELVGEVEVYKSSQANLPEGGVGGTVIVNTRKPMSLDANTAFFSVKGDYGSISKKTDPELSGLYSWKNDDETFGFLFAAAYAETSYQRNGIESLLGWGDIVPTTFEQERERTALNATFQYRPSQNLDIGLNLLSLDMKANNANTSLFVMFPDDKDAACEARNASGTCTFYRRGADDENPGWGQTWARIASMSSDTVDLNFTYEADSYTLKGRAGHTKADGGTDLTANYGFWLGQPADYAGTYDATGKVIDINIANKHFTADDFQANLGPEGWSLKKQPNSDEETYARLDLSIPVTLGVISEIHTGASWSNHEVKTETFTVDMASTVPNNPASRYYSGTVSSAAGFTLPRAHLGNMIADANAAIANFVDTSIDYRSGYGTIKERNVALYLMADYFTDTVRGNFGLRYVRTNAESDFFNFTGGVYDDVLSTDKASYTEVLPSFNIAYNVTDDVILRGSLAQVIARPNYYDMFSRSSFSGYADGTPGNEVVTKGNVGLAPFKATQGDLGIEYYFSSRGMSSATFFFKNVDTFVTSGQLLNQQIGVVDPDSGEDNWTVATILNGKGGDIYGVELQTQNAFDNGFGYVANYTFVDASSPSGNYPDEIGRFSDSSRHSLNLVGYYEADDYTVRVAYNWRSAYMMRELPGFYGNREHQSYGSLDLSAGYQISENLNLTFEVVNLLEEDSVQLGVAPAEAEVIDEFKNGYPAWFFEGERRVKFGLSYRF
ncbi:TonB-dependent receptor [Alkalimonas collagenimarina]